MLPSLSLRLRLFLALFLATVIPAGLLLTGGYLAFREVVTATGSAGPWAQVAESGAELLDELEREERRAPELERARERHRAELSESVRYSRIYSLLAERILFLLPLAAAGLLLTAGAFALWAATAFSRRLSVPVEELVDWTVRLGREEPLPPTGLREASGAPEFQELRLALRRMEGELARARREAVERARLRSWTEMARRVAHDLRNPLTPMTLAARTAAASKEPGVARAGEVLQEEIRRLDEMARAFQDFGRPTEGPPAPVALEELLEGLVGRIGREPVPVELHLPSRPVWIQGHALALERVVRNLVVNAQEAVLETAAGDRVPVEVRLEEKDGEAAIRVLDRGPGLPDEAEDRIWDPEFTTRRRGTGLGLALVRQVVAAHHGSVSARNREGGGAEFRVCLPAGKLPLEAHGTEESR